MKSTFLFWVPMALFLLTHCPYSYGEEAKAVNAEKFIKLLSYELQNRAFAYSTIDNVVTKPDKVKNIKFWQAYLALENHNRVCYRPIAEKHKLSVEAGRLTKIRAGVSAWLVRVSESYSMGIIHNATQKYVGKLEALKEMATDDQEFFSYVVAQEKIQLQAMRLVLDGKSEEAEKLIYSFISNQEANSENGASECALAI